MHNPTQHTPQRAGFSLVEVIIAITLLTVILTASTRLFISQTKAVASHAGRLDALQNARFAINAVDRELRMTGAGVVDAQPMVVQADQYAITFNGDLVSKTGADVAAVYYDPDVPLAATISLGSAAKITLPLSTAQYPDTNYTQGSGAAAPTSTAETISYWLAADPGGSATDFALFRRVNAQPAQIVARGLVKTTGEPIFRYFKPDSMGNLIEIAPAVLPLIHSAKVHNSIADSAKSALTDSIRVVRIKLKGRFIDRDGKQVLRTVESSIRVMNAGLIRHATCGEAPVFGKAVTATVTASVPKTVQVQWARSADETTGEKDVERYAIYRRSTATATFGEPMASMAAGQANYSFIDSQVASGEGWVYGISAQDCTPANSPISASGAVIIP